MKQTNLLFIGCLYSQNRKNEYLNNSKWGYQFAAQNFQEALIRGFKENNVTPHVLTIPALSSYLSGYNKLLVKSEDFIYDNKCLGQSAGYINLPFLRNLSQRVILRKAYEWCKTKDGKKIVLIYGLHENLMKIAVKLKSRYNDIIIALIALDLPIFMGYNRIYKALGLKTRKIKIINRLIPKFDAYIVLTEPMANYMGITDKPYLIIEGIYGNPDLSQTHLQSDTSRCKVILYTGALMLKYGIDKLVDAFTKIPDQTYRLWLCGTGDAVEYINIKSRQDSRIIYKGVLPQDEIYKLQQKARLLVNPRSSKEEFTMYSFPSKTMEYMASGTPVIMCRLKCIPEEYNEHLYFFNNEDINSMAEDLKAICDLNDDVLISKGLSAAEFINSQKSSLIQVRKILNLLSTTSEIN